jgi:hypothetical protein
MNIELRQVEKFEALVDEFENRLNELKTEALEGQQLFFRSIEDLEEKFSSGRWYLSACCLALCGVVRGVTRQGDSYCLYRLLPPTCSIIICAHNTTALLTVGVGSPSDLHPFLPVGV